MDTSQTDQLAELIATRHECLERLVELGHAQLQLIEANDLPRLLRVLATKQTLIGRLQAVTASLAPFRGQDPESRVWRSPELRQQTGDRLRQCDDLFAVVTQQEHESEARLQTKRDSVGERLRTAQSADQARSAYTTPHAKSIHHLDLATNE